MAKLRQVKSINVTTVDLDKYYSISQTSRLLFLGWDLLAIIELRRHKGM